MHKSQCWHWQEGKGFLGRIAVRLGTACKLRSQILRHVVDDDTSLDCSPETLFVTKRRMANDLCQKVSIDF